jgi:mono/diheme cytochrome c family protein
MRVALVLAVVMIAPAAHAQEAERGLAFVQTHCARCHAVSGTGPSPNRDAPTFRDISGRYPPEQLAEALAEGIMVSHESAMPEFQLEPRDIGDVIAYLERLRRGG